jgi:SiaC family regulatory phosphoprotein
MEILSIEGTDDTPKIILDKKNGKFEISGRSLPEDSVEFYKPILEWITDYSKEPNATTQFVFKLEYSNTSSSKLIQDILVALEKIKGVNVLWCFQKDDEDMEEAGREFSDRVDIPFEFKLI